MSSFETKFSQLCESSIAEQTEVFLQSFVLSLGDEWKTVLTLKKSFESFGDGDVMMEMAQASVFLQQHGAKRTALQRREELRDIDLDGNGKISFIEMLLLQYKV